MPKYQKAFESLFFAVFLALYYAVLVERNPRHITGTEVFLYVWIAAFACDEFGEFRDAGTLFYAADFWSLWDIIVIAIGIAFFISSTPVNVSQPLCALIIHQHSLVANALAKQESLGCPKTVIVSSIYLLTYSRLRRCF